MPCHSTRGEERGDGDDSEFRGRPQQPGPRLLSLESGRKRSAFVWVELVHRGIEAKDSGYRKCECGSREKGRGIPADSTYERRERDDRPAGDDRPYCYPPDRPVCGLLGAISWRHGSMNFSDLQKTPPQAKPPVWSEHPHRSTVTALTLSYR